MAGFVGLDSDPGVDASDYVVYVADLVRSGGAEFKVEDLHGVCFVELVVDEDNDEEGVVEHPGYYKNYIQ